MSLPRSMQDHTDGRQPAAHHPPPPQQYAVPPQQYAAPLPNYAAPQQHYSTCKFLSNQVSQTQSRSIVHVIGIPSHRVISLTAPDPQQYDERSNTRPGPYHQPQAAPYGQPSAPNYQQQPPASYEQAPASYPPPPAPHYPTAPCGQPPAQAPPQVAPPPSYGGYSQPTPQHQAAPQLYSQQNTYAPPAPISQPTHYQPPTPNVSVPPRARARTHYPDGTPVPSLKNKPQKNPAPPRGKDRTHYFDGRPVPPLENKPRVNPVLPRGRDRYAPQQHAPPQQYAPPRQFTPPPQQYVPPQQHSQPPPQYSVPSQTYAHPQDMPQDHETSQADLLERMRHMFKGPSPPISVESFHESTEGEGDIESRLQYVGVSSPSNSTRHPGPSQGKNRSKYFDGSSLEVRCITYVDSDNESVAAEEDFLENNANDSEAMRLGLEANGITLDRLEHPDEELYNFPGLPKHLVIGAIKAVHNLRRKPTLVDDRKYLEEVNRDWKEFQEHDEIVRYFDQAEDEAWWSISGNILTSDDDYIDRLAREFQR